MPSPPTTSRDFWPMPMADEVDLAPQRVVPPGAGELGQLYAAVRNAFRSARLATPDLDARLLVTETLRVTTAQLIANPRLAVTSNTVEALNERAEARLSGVSIGRILGRRSFWSLDLSLAPDTLEPRPETETVVELALDILDAPDGEFRIADLGTGTGAILLAVLSERPNAVGIGVDLSEAAVRQAQLNADRFKFSGRAHFLRGDYGAPLRGEFDVIMSNPPYIATEVIQTLSPTVRDHDPWLALDGGPDGLAAYRALTLQTPRLLKPTGRLIVEIDPASVDDVIHISRRHGFETDRTVNDLSGRVRALSLKLAG